MTVRKENEGGQASGLSNAANSALKYGLLAEILLLDARELLRGGALKNTLLAIDILEGDPAERERLHEEARA